MKKYIALLRGINVGGNNKISMPELKAAFEKNGFKNVVTYINSGNIIFESGLNEIDAKKSCEELIAANFGLKILVCIISAAELADAMNHTPDWWNKSSDCKHNALFVMPPMTPEKVCNTIGEVKTEYKEKVSFHGKVIFWTAPIATFSKTSWSKMSTKRDAYNAVTIRNANTTLKLLELIK